MNRLILTAVTLLSISNSLFAAEVCTVSMMGRVCYEETDEKLTAGHMYNSPDKDKSKLAEKDNKEAKKVAENSKK